MLTPMSRDVPVHLTSGEQGRLGTFDWKLIHSPADKSTGHVM